MSNNVIVSFDGTENDHDALAFGRVLREAGAQISLAYVRHATESDADREKQAQAEAAAILDRGAKWLKQNDIARHVVVNASTGEGLRGLAAQ
jgi:NAD(P)H-hydrate repair Nnr-like enzyme with NAD(P)H-hydrate epimerase domain